MPRNDICKGKQQNFWLIVRLWIRLHIPRFNNKIQKLLFHFICLLLTPSSIADIQEKSSKINSRHRSIQRQYIPHLPIHKIMFQEEFWKLRCDYFISMDFTMASGLNNWTKMRGQQNVYLTITVLSCCNLINDHTLKVILSQSSLIFQSLSAF